MRADQVLRQPDSPQGARRAASEREARIEGTFKSPRGDTGTMSGWLRLARFVVVRGKLYAVGVFAGELRHADGTRIGVGSRRQLAPAVISNGPAGTVAEIGPVEVDLLGLTVDIRPFTIGVRTIVAATMGGGVPSKSTPVTQSSSLT